MDDDGDAVTDDGCAAGHRTEDAAILTPAVRLVVGSETAFEQLSDFAALLGREGETRGLIGPRELPRLWSRHIVNSLAINEFVPEGATVADMGSGAGFPGVVLAITRPDVKVALIDSMERRTEWLEHVRVTLGLKNVVVVTNRAEALHEQRYFDVVTARAVAPMDRLARWALPLVRPGGRLVALKGERAVVELNDAREVIRKEGGSGAKVREVASPLDGTITRVVVVERMDAEVRPSR